jgi:hypothetical protein
VLTPKTLAYCQYWQLFGNGLSNNNPPDNRHIIAKIFIKYFYSIALIHQYFCPKAAIAGLQEHGGVRGELPFPPFIHIF